MVYINKYSPTNTINRVDAIRRYSFPKYVSTLPKSIYIQIKLKMVT